MHIYKLHSLNINKPCITLSPLSSSSGFFTIFFKRLCRGVMDLQPSWKRRNFAELEELEGLGGMQNLPKLKEQCLSYAYEFVR